MTVAHTSSFKTISDDLGSSILTGAFPPCAPFVSAPPFVSNLNCPPLPSSPTRPRGSASVKTNGSHKKKRKRRVKKSGAMEEPPSHELSRPICHVFSSNSASSQRTRAAAGAHLSWDSSRLLSRNTLKNRKKYAKKKLEKQSSKLHALDITDEMISAGARFSKKHLEDCVVVFDGGKGVSTAASPENPSLDGWECIRIDDGPLVICEPPSDDKGLMFVGPIDNQPRFILLPREEALAINSNGRELCAAMTAIAKKSSNLSRGASKSVFGGKKYCCVGSKANRNSAGVTPGLFKVGVVRESEWNCVVKAVKRCEHAFYSYANTTAIRHIREARELVQWEGIHGAGDQPTSSSIYSGIAFGVNVFLRAHVDDDYTYSVIQVHIDNMDYAVDDEVVCYFCFPCLGVAVPLHPGDFLLINALEYHCISSRCKDYYNLFAVSSYLKTAVVGGNDNSALLSMEERKCFSFYEERVTKKA
jgi:hypothetical protein